MTAGYQDTHFPCCWAMKKDVNVAPVAAKKRKSKTATTYMCCDKKDRRKSKIACSRADTWRMLRKELALGIHI